MTFDDHSRFEELAALSAGGYLSAEELGELREHVQTCEQCAEAEAEFIEVVRSGLPLTQSPMREFLDRARHKPEKGARERFLQQARREGIVFSSAIDRRLEGPNWHVGLIAGVAGAAALTTAIAMAVLYPKIASHQPVIVPSQAQVEELKRENLDLRAKLARQQPPASTQSPEIDGLREQLQAEVKAAESNAQAADQLRQEMQQETARNAQLLTEIQDRDKLLADAKAELTSLEKKRGEDQASTVALQTRVNELSEQLRTANASLDMERQLLAQGKEVRDLMGARQLHVVDVRDTDPTGKPGKAFGRVFLTEGKSLIFYAFDLNDTKLADAKHTFQVWGQEESKPASVRSLGFLYVDDKAQRRWALKVDDPKLVSEIDSVFVTVEPAGGGKKPSGQRMLYAYLGEANHP